MAQQTWDYGNTGEEAREKLLKGNYVRLFDDTRRRVRAWEAANVKAAR